MKQISNAFFLIFIFCSFINTNRILKKLIISEVPETTYLPNSNFMYRGYDIFFGDMLQGNTDPGFRKNIFEASYKKEQKTSDRRYYVGDGFSLSMDEVCSVDMTSTIITGEESYLNSFENEFSVSGTYKAIEFSASNTFKKVSEETSSKSKAFIFSKSECSVYTGEIDLYEPPLFHSSFLKALKNLSKFKFNDNMDYYWNFIKAFGTHFITHIKMGARFGVVSKTSQEEIAALKSLNVGFEAGISMENVFEINNKFEHENERTDNVLTEMEEVKIFSIGSRPSEDLSNTSWANQVFDQPMPISYTVAPIMEVFDEGIFMTDQNQFENIDLPFLKQNLQEAYENYCKLYLIPKQKVRSCDHINKDTLINISKPDKIHDQAVYTFHNIGTGTCLSSAGIKLPLVSLPCENSSNTLIQLFKTVYYSGHWYIHIAQSHNRSLCLDLFYDLNNDYTPIITYFCENNSAQQFEIIENVDFSYTFKTNHNKCVEIKDGNRANNSKIVHNKCNGLLEQKWRAKRTYIKYTIQPGDNLNNIAKKYSTSVQAIMQLNPEIKSSEWIYIGQIINII